MSPPQISLVIPAYNEAGRLPASLGRIRAFLDRHSLRAEVLVIVERSSDGTLSEARRAVGKDSRFKIRDNRVHRGKGYAVRSGMRRARGELVFYMDADLSTPLEEIPRFVAYFREHPEVQVLIGSRAEPDSRILRRQKPLRENLGKIFNCLVQALAIRGIRDTQCGFKAFRHAACAEIFSRQRLDGFAFDVEVLLLAQAMGLKIMPLPVAWINSPESRVRLIRDTVGMALDLMRVRRLVRKTLRESPPSIAR